jgi:hypothetical protein
MLEFPFYSTIGLAGLFFPIGIVILVAAFRQWRYELRRRNGPTVKTFEVRNLLEERSNTTQRVLSSLAGLAFTSCGALVLFQGGYEIYKFRKVDISHVVGFHVQRVKGDDYVPSDAIDFTKTSEVRKALSTLKTCNEIRPNHEHFYDGYKIRLLFDDPKVDDYFISAYARSSTSATRSSVEPHISPARAINLGDYQCPTFQQWLAENIDPLFPDPPKRSQ